MSKIYNNAFCIGVSINILIFVILNIISLIVSRNEHIEMQIKMRNSGISYGSNYEYFWGFPFEMFGDMELLNPRGLVINTFIITICSFIAGFLFKSIWSKISPRRVKLK